MFYVVLVPLAAYSSGDFWRYVIGVADGRFERMPHQYRPLLLLLCGAAIAVVVGVPLR